MANVNGLNGGRPVATSRSADPDARGQAALLLAESTLHLLVETGALTRAQAVDAVVSAASVKREWAEEDGESSVTMHRSLALLGRIERSVAAIGTE